MRYYIKDNSLIIRGDFYACSSGIDGGIREVTTIFNHTVPTESVYRFSEREMENLTRKHGMTPEKSFGLITSIPMDRVCVLNNDYIDLFVTAGSPKDIPVSIDDPCGINIILLIHEPLSDQALLSAIITATEAKASAIRDIENNEDFDIWESALENFDLDHCGNGMDAVIVAADKKGDNPFYGTASVLGMKIFETVREGVKRALDYSMQEKQKGPYYIIRTNIGEEHWHLWNQNGCQYYPCHFKGQRCNFCYCPLYPCKDESLGEFVSRSNGQDRIWSCSKCTLNHEPAVVSHLLRNPEAKLDELKRISKNNQQ